MQINLTTEQFLVLKDLISETLTATGVAGVSPEEIERFHQQIVAAAAFNSHGMTISETGISCP